MVFYPFRSLTKIVHNFTSKTKFDILENPQVCFHTVSYMGKLNLLICTLIMALRLILVRNWFSQIDENPPPPKKKPNENKKMLSF